MVGYMGKQDYEDDIREVVGESLVFAKIGTFRKDEWFQHCQAAGQVNIHTLIVDLQCTDEEVFVKGIRQFRFARNARIILLASGKTPGDPTVAALVSLGVWDILVPHDENDEEDAEEVGPSLADELAKQLAKSPSYAEAARWHVEVEPPTTRKKSTPRSRLFAQKDSTEDAEQEAVVRETVVVHNQLVGTVVIAVTGVYEGVGTTHTALLIAHYLAQRKHKVALVEANGSSDFEAIEYVYEGMNNYVSVDRSFTIGGVQYIKSSAVGRTPLIPPDHHYLILDLGYYEASEWFEEFWRAHLQIVVGAGSEWRQREIFRFRERHQAFETSPWRVAVPFVEPQVIQDIEKELPGHPVFSIPAHPDPFKSNQETDAALLALLQPVLVDKRAKTKRGIWALLGVVAVLLWTVLMLIKK